MRKSQWKQVPEDPQEKNGEQERPAMTVEDLRKIFEPQKTNRPQRKSDDRGKVFEVQDQIGTGCKSHVLHLGVDQNRNIPNQDILGNKLEPQERSEKTPVKSEDPQGKNETHWTSYGEQGRPAMTVGDLRKIYEPQKTNRPQRKSEKYEQEKEELQHKLAHTLDRSEHLPVTVDDICEKFDKYEEEKEELQHKFDDLQKTCEYTLGRREQLFSATVDNICEKLDKYEEEKEDLQHKFDDLQKKWAHIPDRMDKLSATVDDICEKLDKCEHDKEELQHKFDDLQKKCVGNTLDIREQLSATVDDIWGKFEEHQRKFEYSLSKKEQSSSTHEELQHQFEELQHQFERPQKIFDKKEQGKEDLPQKIEELQKKLDKYKQEKEELQKKSEDLQKEIDRRKAQFKLGWRESTLYPDWRKEEFQAVNVTLDEATAHPSLLLTEEGRGVTLQEIQQDLPSSTQRFVSIPCVLGQLQICAGRYYWEVEVGDLHSWDLGVCRDNVSRKGTFQMSPQNGFWAIRLYQEDYWALTISETHLTLREKPLSVGIFLDYEAGDVSFYNMTDESHIFTFSKQTFYGVLRPLFRLWSPDSGPLTTVQVE